MERFVRSERVRFTKKRGKRRKKKEKRKKRKERKRGGKRKNLRTQGDIASRKEDVTRGSEGKRIKEIHAMTDYYT